MNRDELEKRLVAAWDPKDDQPLRHLILEVLKAGRAAAIEAFAGVLGNLPGDHRLKMLVTLSEDGDKDLVPIFIEAIRKEPNLEIATSVLSLYEGFENHEALEAFLAMEGEKRPELDLAWRQTSAALKAHFKEQFNIYRYRLGRKNLDRATAVAQEMISQPHHAYLPFLNKEIRHPGTLYRLQGVELLAEMGDATSLSPLLAVLPLVFEENQRTTDFFHFLIDPANLAMTSLLEYLQTLGAIAGWEETFPESLIPEIKREKVWTTIKTVRGSFELSDSIFWQEASQFMRGVLLGRSSDTEKIVRLQQTFASFIDQQDQLVETICKTLGLIGNRCQITHLHDRLEEKLPESLASRGSLMVSFMVTYRSPECCRRLLALLDSAKPAPFLLKVLSVIATYTFDDVPAEILEQVVHPSDIDVRRKAQEILVGCTNAAAALDPLLAHESEDVRKYTVAMIATHRMEGAYPKLLAQLPRKMPTSLLNKIIDTLGLFERPEHATQLTPFLVFTHLINTRRAALGAIIKSTEPTRLILILQALQKYQPTAKMEMVEVLLDLMVDQTIEKLPPAITLLRDFWSENLDSKNDSIRLNALTVLERTDWWSEDVDLPSWKKLLKLAKGRFKDIKSPQELERLEKLYLMVAGGPEEKPAAQDGKKRPFAKLLDKVEAASDPIRAWRHFNLIFKPVMLAEEPDQADRFCDLLCGAVQAALGSADELRFLCTLAAKTEWTKCIEQVRKLASAAQDAEAEKPEEKRDTIQRILLVDDSLIILMALKRTLVQAGFTVVTANHPSSGLDFLGKESFDLIVIDYLMPEKTGVELMAEAHKMGCAPAYTIFITSTRDGADIKDILSCEPNGLLLKPFPPEKLLEKIAELVTPH